MSPILPCHFVVKTFAMVVGSWFMGFVNKRDLALSFPMHVAKKEPRHSLPWWYRKRNGRLVEKGKTKSKSRQKA